MFRPECGHLFTPCNYIKIEINVDNYILIYVFIYVS